MPARRSSRSLEKPEADARCTAPGECKRQLDRSRFSVPAVGKRAVADPTWRLPAHAESAPLAAASVRRSRRQDLHLSLGTAIGAHLFLRRCRAGLVGARGIPLACGDRDCAFPDLRPKRNVVREGLTSSARALISAG